MTARITIVLMIIAIPMLGVGCSTTGPHAPSRPSTSTTKVTRARPGATSAAWLGLNYNSSAGAGALTEFSHRGIVYDRLGHLATNAGETVASSRELAHGLQVALAARMVPDVMISPVIGPNGCTTDPNGSELCLPDTASGVTDYVRAFLRTVLSIRRAFPQHRIIFEPMNEPWNWAPPPGTASGARAASLYAAVLAHMLPALKRGGVPLSRVYVPATGVLADGSYWIPDLYRAQPCLAPGIRSCGPIEGWNFHPYGPPQSQEHGIEEIPLLRGAMHSGEDNIIVSEVGFCATNAHDSRCDQNTPTVDGSSAQTARWLAETLLVARQMHDAGWLKALIIWERVGGGWAMQLPDGRLTAEGRALISFAHTSSR